MSPVATSFLFPFLFRNWNSKQSRYFETGRSDKQKPILVGELFENVTTADKLLIASVAIRGPQPTLESIAEEVDENGMSDAQLELIEKTLTEEINDANSPLQWKINIVSGGVSAVVVTTTTSTSTTVTTTSSTLTSTTVTETPIPSTTTVTEVTTSTITETVTTTLPSIQRGFGFVVELVNPAAFGLDDCTTSTELENSAKYAMAQLIKEQTSEENYDALLGLEGVSITLLPGTVSGLIASIGIHGPKANLDEIADAIEVDGLTAEQKEILEKALIFAIDKRPSISAKLSIKTNEVVAVIVTTTTSTSTSKTLTSVTSTSTTTSAATSTSITTTSSTVTSTTVTETTTFPSIQRGFGFKITIKVDGLSLQNIADDEKLKAAVEVAFGHLISNKTSPGDKNSLASLSPEIFLDSSNATADIMTLISSSSSCLRSASVVFVCFHSFRTR